MMVTPREVFWAFAIYALALVLATSRARIPMGSFVRRLGLGAPFVLFALALPFLARGPDVEVFGLALSREGLWAAWNVVAKATLGLAVVVLVASTTSPADLLRGFDRLHAPRVPTAIAGFMVRYADVLTGEMRRMRIAREARGYDPRRLWQARAVASSVGTLFIRSYERGERVYNAMLSRGFDGRLSPLWGAAAPAADWVAALSAAGLAAAVAAIAILFR